MRRRWRRPNAPITIAFPRWELNNDQAWSASARKPSTPAPEATQTIAARGERVEISMLQSAPRSETERPAGGFELPPASVGLNFAPQYLHAASPPRSEE